jgi:hypothetical protein
VKVSISGVISLEGVGSRLWTGTRKGLIYAYDVTGGAITRMESEVLGKDVGLVETEPTPWIVTNIWKAHGELPVARIVVDPFSVAKVSLNASLTVSPRLLTNLHF